VSGELLALFFIVAATIAIACLERLRPYDRGYRVLREGFWDDLFGYTVVQSYLVGLLIARLIAWLDGTAGWSRLGLVAGWPLWTQVVFFVVTHDLYIYWFHRWQHSSPLLWRLHEAHHSSQQVDWLAATRSHALEILINQTVEFAPIVLLGAAPEVALVKGVISALWGLWIHANVEVHTGRLQWLVNGPEAHRWHHAVDPDGHGRNFATKLALWDRLFGTSFLPVGRKPSGYGLGAADAFPRRFLAQQWSLFTR
jgi:sterol desaturase/sphingolipid hydroxylase (fatty acid hydroxylase superfamily)